MFQTFISRHNSNFFSNKLVLTSVTPAFSAPVLQTAKATSSTLYFDSLPVNAGKGGFPHCIQMDACVNAANKVVFFSSRRRHTRGSRDWSSDVCSSDLFSLATVSREHDPRCHPADYEGIDASLEPRGRNQNQRQRCASPCCRTAFHSAPNSMQSMPSHRDRKSVV